MCVLIVDDPSGRVLILGDAGTADQEDLCAVYGSQLDAELVVTPPGGAISPVLLATVRPSNSQCPLPRVSLPRRHPRAIPRTGPAPTATSDTRAERPD
jgi:hypothetical protein